MMKKMYKTFWLLLIVMSRLSMSSYAQNAIEQIKRSSIFLDFTNQGPCYSVNFDRIFSDHKKNNFAYRVGLHFFDQNFGLPLGISMLTGLSNHHAEFSLTLIPFIKNFNYLFKEGNLSDKQLYIVPGIGYRFQKPDGGILVKGLVSPMIFLDPPSDNFWNMDPKINPALNLGIGWTFRKKR